MHCSGHAQSLLHDHLSGSRQEYKEAAKAEAETGIQLIPDESNIYVWKAVIQVWRTRSMQME